MIATAKKVPATKREIAIGSQVRNATGGVTIKRARTEKIRIAKNTESGEAAVKVRESPMRSRLNETGTQVGKL